MTHRHDDDNIYPNVQTQTRELLKRFDAAPRTPTRTTVVETIGSVLIAAIFGLMLAWVGINWVTGCGETFITYTGERIHGECVFMPWRD
jgi:hypothetical protein